MQNYTQTIISQYANSPTLTQLIANFNYYIDPSQDIDAFYKLVWNIDTAEGYGLDVWGRIVGVARIIRIADINYFGFAEASNLSAAPFNQGPFYTGEPLTNGFALADKPFRQLILAKAAANITDGSIPGINAILRMLFPGRGNCFVNDLGNMQIEYVFDFDLTPVEETIVIASGVLPRPPGVRVTWRQL